MLNAIKLDCCPFYRILQQKNPNVAEDDKVLISLLKIYA